MAIFGIKGLLFQTKTKQKYGNFYETKIWEFFDHTPFFTVLLN
jgi:hypothetical protein